MEAFQRVLIVEDDYILATDLAWCVEAAGYGIIGPVPSVDQALAAIDEERPSAAILDIQLLDEKCFPVADRLVEIGVPFVFLTGYTKLDLPERLRHRPILAKLVDQAKLLDLLADLVGTGNKSVNRARPRL